MSLWIKMGTITINTFSPMRAKFVYSYGVKTCSPGFDELMESIFCLLLVVEAFSLQKVLKIPWRSGGRLARGQVSMADEAKLRSPTCSAFWGVWLCSRASSWRRIGPFLLTSASCGPCNFQCLSSICWACFSDVMICQDSESCSGPDGQQTTRQWPWPFLVQVWLWDVLQNFSVQPLSWSLPVVV